MKPILTLVFAGLIAFCSPTFAADTAADDPLFHAADMKDLSQFKWKKRPVLVFADSEDDPAFIEQIALLEADSALLADRDVIVLTDTDATEKSALRLKMRPRGFMLVLVGKDGRVKLRKPFPWSVREISRSIDKMPMRKREIREHNAAPNGR